ncbi:MAG: MFS transporter, partial [Christensenellales bacterium]
MKLNYKYTFIAGLAFLTISAFWQLYDFIIPLILHNRFGVDHTTSGFIMSIDNIIALLLLPLFGAISDRTNTAMGRRMPFVIFGTIAAVLFMMALPLATHMGNIIFFMIALGLVLLAMAVYRSPAVALMPDITPKPFRSKGNAVINLMGALGGAVILLLNSFLAPD